MRALILGGSRFVGRLVAEQLLAAGAEVTVLHRNVGSADVSGVEAVAGDRGSDDVLGALEGRTFDTVVDMSAYSSSWTLRTAALLAGRTDHYVFVSSGAVYEPSPELPWPEDAPIGPMAVWGAYALEKVASEQALWDAQSRGAFACTIVRLPFILGPGNFADREAFVLSRIAAELPVLVPGASAINQFLHAADAAQALVAAALRPEVSRGRTYNAGYARGITNRAFVELCAQVLRRDAWIVPIDEAALGVESPTVDLTDVVFPFPSTHYLLDVRRLSDELGVIARATTRAMVDDFAGHWLEHGDQRPRLYAREDRALAALDLPRHPSPV